MTPNPATPPPVAEWIERGYTAHSVLNTRIVCHHCGNARMVMHIYARPEQAHKAHTFYSCPVCGRKECCDD